MLKKSADSPIAYYISRCGCNAEWLCFLHAAFVDHRMFQKQIDAFQNAFNILAVDIIGHGESTDTCKGDGIEKMSGWIKTIMTEENIEKIHIVGVSLGAVLAQDFANHYPHATASLACFGGYDINHFDVKLQKENGAAQMLMMSKALFSIKWFAEANKKIYAYTESAQNECYKMNIQFPKRSFMFLAGLNGMVNKYRTNRRNYPLLIGYGKHDIPMEQKAVALWKKSEPDCEVVVFENAGHCVNMDVPQRFNEVMERFWLGGKQ